MEDNKCLVAVYGTLMTGEVNFRWRKDVPTVAIGSMKGKLYDTGFGFPAFVPNATGNMVRCELLECNRNQIENMDILEGYPRLYRREFVKVQAGGREVSAIVYVMNNLPKRASVIKSGDWCKYRRERTFAR